MLYMITNGKDNVLPFALDLKNYEQIFFPNTHKSHSNFQLGRLECDD